MTVKLYEVLYQGDGIFFVQVTPAHKPVEAGRYWWTEFDGQERSVGDIISGAYLEAYKAIGAEAEHVIYDAEDHLLDEDGENFEESFDAMDLLAKQVAEVGAEVITSLTRVIRSKNRPFDLTEVQDD